MPSWYHKIGDCIEWEDGSIDAVYTDVATGEVQFKTATPKQIEMFRRYKALVKRVRPQLD